MAEKNEAIMFTGENGEQIPFYVLEQTMINGVNYILVVDSEDEDEDVEALILKEVQSADTEESVYEIVDDDAEWDALSKVFEELLDDVDFEH